MPELPEVETVVRTLRPLLCGRAIAAVKIVGQPLRRPWKQRWTRRLNDGRRIEAVRRRAKWIILDLSEDDCLLVHLGMTGRLRVVSSELPLEVHTHLVFPLETGREDLRFQDVRRFGSVTLLKPKELEQEFAESRLGVEPFEMTTALLWAQLRSTTRCLKAVLLDQRVAAGVGNIYADEALFEARLHPTRRGCDVSRKEAGRLRQAIINVLERAIEKKGSTIRNFLYGENGRGGYQDEFRVYQRTGEPCRRCRTPIERLRLAGRSTHYCPKCQ